MLKSHEKFHSENGKRLVLVASESTRVRSFLGQILDDSYILLFARDAHEAQDLIRGHGDVLSLILLHLQAETSLDLLSLVLSEPELKHIPVTIIHEDHEIEAQALAAGAIDFIPQPFPQTEIILARIRRTIELSEDRAIISSTERDTLTGLYNREYFYRYAEQYDHHHKNTEMDAIVIDINNFRTINERFGTAYGDEILRQIGERVRDMVKDSGGIVCRREADTFQVYCPHGKNYQAILDNASIGLAGGEAVSDRVRLRMGVYSQVDKRLDIERRFDRANMAADSVRASFTKTIAFYDSSLHERELEDARMVEEFQTAIRQKQFKVYYQPKFDVRTDTPVLASAEALVRWDHPKRGLISPGRFIPLFEENGLVHPLDHYVWEEVARQIRDWKYRLGFSVPISVNVSRVNMYDPNLIDFLLSILKKYDISQTDLYLEITESAYTEDSEQIISKVGLLRDLGFRIEMDDFGTGYSSLNMISKLPIDVLKLDMQFVRSAFRGTKNTRMMEIMLDIAEYLDVPVVAEGVETEEQLTALKDMGCEVIQGYYFSRPIPAAEFETFLIRRRKQGDLVPVCGSSGKHIPPVQDPASGAEAGGVNVPEIALTLFKGYSRIFEVDPVTEQYTEFRLSEDGSTLKTEREGIAFFDYHRRHLVHYMHPEDQKSFLETFSKGHMIHTLEKQGTYSGVFRLIFGQESAAVCLQASSEGSGEQRRIIIGLSNVDVQNQPERGLQDMVRTVGRDPLTSTKNLTAYIQMERQINDAISRSIQEDFALVVVDMNGYREICGRLGQAAGDQCVQELSRIVCDIFTHSPVYRIGDDEFVVILRRRDYVKRRHLMDDLIRRNDENAAGGGITFAYGMAEYLPDADNRLSNIFERANAQMYPEGGV